MTDAFAQFPKPQSALARLPAMAVGSARAVVLTVDGDFLTLTHRQAADHLSKSPHILCNAPLITRRLRTGGVASYDILELFAFVRPARFTLPTIGGVMESLAQPMPLADLADEALALKQAAAILLADPAADTYRWQRGISAIAHGMARAGWPWGPLVLGALGSRADRKGSMALWQDLPEWEDGPPPPPPSDHKVTEDEAAQRLADILGDNAETREAQKDYSRAAAHAFSPCTMEGAPNVMLAEAGTGTGKTLGYIAPASVWASKNEGTVWLSTYTKALQRQLDQELARLYPDPKVRAARVTVRKGRENYACLLNIEEAARISFSGAATARDAVLMGLVLRWLAYSRNGDMVGGDFPGWLGSYFGRARLGALTDHRGECLYSACSHYRRCFIEGVIRKTRRSELVVANHALVMIQAATRQGDPDLPNRLVFDEGHHLFSAADSAFSAHLSGLEGAELRRWLRGREETGKGRARGLLARISDLIADNEEAMPLLEAVLEAARILPGPGWLQRMSTGSPRGPYEVFLTHVRDHVLARTSNGRDRQSGHSLECGTEEPGKELLEASARLARLLDRLSSPIKNLGAHLLVHLNAHSDTLDSGSRGRLDATARSLALRADLVRTWSTMLKDLQKTRPADFIDWFELERIESREINLGLFRHWIDPTKPFAKTVLEPAHGALITSATLLDRQTAEDQQNWRTAETRTGASHLVQPAKRLSVPSPFDYAANTRILIVNDLKKGDVAQLAAACRELFVASHGGALGLFTAIARLRSVHARIREPLEHHNLPLYAQHVDPIDTGTLVDIFRASRQACLLGTDAVRDGVDVPGDALRLIAFDRVPWPRPTILHKARRAAFGGSSYDDMLTRLKMAQAFGRLVRRKNDRGIFVMLDAQTPTRLLSAFPPDAPVTRLGLADAVHTVRAFFDSQHTAKLS